MKIRIFFIFLFIFTKATYSQEPCIFLFKNREKTQEIKPKEVIEIKNGEDFLHWISSPSFNWQLLKEPAIEKAFILTLKYFFDFSNKNLWDIFGIEDYNLDQLKESFDWLKEGLEKGLMKSPYSKKEFFPNFSVQIRDAREKSFLVTELQDLSQRQIKAGHEVMQILFNIEKNSRYWKERIFRDVQGGKSLLKHGEFEEFINQLNSLDIREKTRQIFYFLHHKREELILEGRKDYSISQMIVDLIHYSPTFYDLNIFKDLKSNSFFEKIQAMHHMMNEREEFITGLGLKLNMQERLFDQILKKYNRPMPSGYSKQNQMEDLYEEVKSIDFQSISFSSELSDSFHVQHLSHFISPFRGYFGFSCASCLEHRFKKALNPQHHYFTVNQKDNFKGYIEVILDDAILKSATQEEKKVQKIAVIQRIQNIQKQFLPVIIEAVRQSLLTKGYVLVRPRFISNLQSSEFSKDKSLTDEFLKIKTSGEEFVSSGIPDFIDYTDSFAIQSLGVDVKDEILGESSLIPRIHIGDRLSLINIKPVDTSFSYEPFDVRLNLDAFISQMLFDLLNQAKNGNFSDQLKYVSLKYTVQKLNGVKHLDFEEVLTNDFGFRLALFLVLFFGNETILRTDSTKIFSEEEITHLLKDRSFLFNYIGKIKDQFRFETVFLFSIWYAKFINFEELIELLKERELLKLSLEIFSYSPYKNRFSKEELEYLNDLKKAFHFPLHN